MVDCNQRSWVRIPWSVYLYIMFISGKVEYKQAETPTKKLKLSFLIVNGNGKNANKLNGDCFGKDECENCKVLIR